MKLRTGALFASLALVLLAPAAANAKARGARATPPRSAPSELVAERSAKAERSTKVDKSDSDGSDAASDTTTAAPTSGGKTIKTKTYSFGAMDVEGKLKTPQLLYFLNRVKLELDMSAPDKRSFMKELAKTADDKSL